MRRRWSRDCETPARVEMGEEPPRRSDERCGAMLILWVLGVLGLRDMLVGDRGSLSWRDELLTGTRVLGIVGVCDVVCLYIIFFSLDRNVFVYINKFVCF